VLTWGLVLGFLLSGLVGLSANAEDKPGYKDIYLTDNRVCKACTWTWENKQQVRLTNRQGNSTLVSPKEVIGIDQHPIIRKITLKSLSGIGLPGPIIVPAAFKDANDYVCKYCDMVGR
jgi:hypothetical protein